METAAQSAEPEIAEELLHFFVDNGERECFAATLYTCYDLIKPDVAMEVYFLSISIEAAVAACMTSGNHLLLLLLCAHVCYA